MAGFVRSAYEEVDGECRCILFLQARKANDCKPASWREARSTLKLQILHFALLKAEYLT